MLEMLEEVVVELLPFIKVLLVAYAASICVTSLVALGTLLVTLQALFGRI